MRASYTKPLTTPKILSILVLLRTPNTLNSCGGGARQYSSIPLKTVSHGQLFGGISFQTKIARLSLSCPHIFLSGTQTVPVALTAVLWCLLLMFVQFTCFRLITRYVTLFTFFLYLCLMSHVVLFTFFLAKTTESVHCAITDPCLHMRHRPSACRLYRFGRFNPSYDCNMSLCA